MQLNDKSQTTSALAFYNFGDTQSHFSICPKNFLLKLSTGALSKQLPLPIIESVN